MHWPFSVWRTARSCTCHLHTRSIIRAAPPKVADCFWLVLAPVPYKTTIQHLGSFTASIPVEGWEKQLYDLFQQYFFSSSGVVTYYDIFPLDWVVDTGLHCRRCQKCQLLQCNLHANVITWLLYPETSTYRRCTWSRNSLYNTFRVTML